MHNGDWNDGWSGAGSWFLMAIMMIVFWGGVIWLAVTLIRRSDHAAHATTAVPTPPHTDRPAPHEILAERFARGEIEPDDYRQRLEVLQTTRRQ